MAKRKIADYPEIKVIIDRLNDGETSEVIAIFIPSHDRKGKPIGEAQKAVWDNQALEIFGRLFRGATAFTNLRGIYQPEKHLRPLFDEPTMVQSLTTMDRVADHNNLMDLGDFCRLLGKKTNQQSVGVVINNFFIDIDMDAVE